MQMGNCPKLDVYYTHTCTNNINYLHRRFLRNWTIYSFVGQPLNSRLCREFKRMKTKKNETCVLPGEPILSRLATQKTVQLP